VSRFPQQQAGTGSLLEARRAVTKLQPSPEGLGRVHRREERRRCGTFSIQHVFRVGCAGIPDAARVWLVENVPHLRRSLLLRTLPSPSGLG
jgi:hypothetical protein